MVAPRLDDPLTADELRAALDYDPATGIFTWKWRTGLRGSSNARNAGKVSGEVSKYGYIRIMLNSRHYLAHRLAWLYIYGHWPNEQIDHINRITSDNRIANLREATHSQNNVRARPMRNNSSGILGVFRSPTKGKWYVSVTRDGKTKHLGTFASIDEAKAVRDEEVRRSYGEFSRVD
jgi:hypothetical protein